jgi:hypothetical protein
MQTAAHTTCNAVDLAELRNARQLQDRDPKLGRTAAGLDMLMMAHASARVHTKEELHKGAPAPA